MFLGFINRRFRKKKKLLNGRHLSGFTSFKPSSRDSAEVSSADTSPGSRVSLLYVNSSRAVMDIHQAPSSRYKSCPPLPSPPTPPRCKSRIEICTACALKGRKAVFIGAILALHCVIFYFFYFYLFLFPPQNNPRRLQPTHSLFFPRTPSITMREVSAAD